MDAAKRAVETNQIKPMARRPGVVGLSSEEANIPRATPEELKAGDAFMKKILNRNKPQFQPPEAAGAKREELAAAKKEWDVKGTDSKYFKNWFGNSKAVDENGEPQLFHHGTTHKFESFSGARENPENYAGSGHYFTTDVDDAEGNYHETGRDLQGRVEQLKGQARVATPHLVSG